MHPHGITSAAQVGDVHAMPEDEGKSYNKSTSESDNGFHCNPVNQGAVESTDSGHDFIPRSQCYEASQQNGETAVGPAPETRASPAASSSPCLAAAQSPGCEEVRQEPSNPFTACNGRISSSERLPPLQISEPRS